MSVSIDLLGGAAAQAEALLSSSAVAAPTKWIG
jgi:hypothetical protein